MCNCLEASKRMISKQALCKACYIAYFSLAIGFEGVNYSILAPFFPLEALNKGTSDYMIGLIVGAFDVSNIIGVFLVPKILNSKTLFPLYILGELASGINQIVFGFLYYSPNGFTFYFISISSRIFGGFISNLVWSTGYPLLNTIEPAWTSKVIAWIEIMMGLGFMIGPPLGSLLFRIGGYPLPFLLNGFLQVFIAISLYFIPRQSSVSNSDFQIDFKMLMSLLITPSSIIYATSVVVFNAGEGMIDVISAPYLFKYFSLTEEDNGYLFGINSAASFFAYFLFIVFMDRGYGGWVYISSVVIFICSIVVFFIQNWFQQLINLYIVSALFIFLGIAAAGANISLYIIVEKLILYTNVTDLEGCKSLTGLYTNLYFSLGRYFGSSIVGGVCYEYLGFFYTNGVEALLLMFTLLLNIPVFIYFGFLSKLYYGVSNK